jgi:PAS domain S-box-containing protein
VIGLAATRQFSRRALMPLASVPLWVSIPLYAAVWVFDLYTPLGLAAGIVYVPLIFCASWFRRSDAVFIAAAVATMLIIAGLLISPESDRLTLETVLFNRLFSITTVWITALILHHQKRTQRQLQRSKEQLQAAIRGSSLGMWDWDVATGVFSFSEQWASMLDYRPDELEPHVRTWKQLLHPDDRAQFEHDMAQYFAGNTDQYDGTQRLRTRSGDWRWMRAMGRAMERAPDGRPLRVVGTQLDIDDRRQAQQQIQQLVAELERSNKELDDFAYIASHDL